MSIRVALLTGMAIFAIVGSSAATTISYQGRLTDSVGVPVPDSSYNAFFSLFGLPQGGTALWSESAVVTTSKGLFEHDLGSQIAIPQGVFLNSDSLFLEIEIEGAVQSPRSRLSTVPLSSVAGNVKSRDDSGILALVSDPASHSLILNNTVGDTAMILSGVAAGAIILKDPATQTNLGSLRAAPDTGGVLQLGGPSTTPDIILQGGVGGDTSVSLPSGSINSEEIADEPGIAIDLSIGIVTLTTTEMNDLVNLTITIPDDGYIVLHGKCYVILSGTTGPNYALIQIDEDENGAALFPYYTQAGLGGFVNTDDSYFPIYVTRTYFKPAGTYEFRMEGRADQPLPALARSWDHILTAVYYSTEYEGVKSITTDPGGFRSPKPIPPRNSVKGTEKGTVFEVDLRETNEGETTKD